MNLENSLVEALRKWLALVMLAASFVLTGAAHAACTASFFEKAYLNEYFFGTSANYLEVFVPNNNQVGATDWSTWSVRVYTGAGTYTAYPMSGAQACSFGSKTYLTYDVPAGLPGTGNAVNVVLYDGSGNEIDYLKFDNKSPLTEYVAPSCTYPANHSTSLLISNYGNKDVARFPDGKGSWSISSLTGANTTNTRCASNDATITKTVSASVIPLGAQANFTITVFNPSNGSISNVAVADLLPGGLVYDSHTATVGTYVPATGAWTIGTLAKNTGATLVINFHGNAVGSYTNTATLTYTGITLTASDSAIANIVQTVSSFNAFESSTGAAAITGVIKTKVAGSAFALDVVAISAGAQASGFNDSVKVELLANTGTPGAGYGADNCPTSSLIIQTIPVAAIAGGRSTITFPAVADAYRDVRVRISYPTTSPTVATCSNDSFAIRPDTLAVSASDSDWQTAGTARTLNTTAATGSVIHKAGQPFTLGATAYNAAASPSVSGNYAGAPIAVLSSCAPATACTSSFGALSIGASFSAGNLNATAASYSEVGAFNLQLQDSGYAAIDAGDTNPDCTASGYYVCSPVTAIGRFVPDHFDTAVVASGGVPMTCSLPPCPALDAAVPAVTGMVYAGQSFTTQITARNAVGATTANYSATTGLSKAVTLAAWDALGSTTTQNPGPGSLANSGVAASAFSNGVASTSTPNYIFNTTPTVPTAIYLRAVDADSVSSLRASSMEGGVKVVSGRIKLSNAYGSELLPLSLTASAQYYGSSGWVTNTGDSASTLSLAATYNLVKNGVTTGTTAASPASGTLSGGKLTINLAKPAGGATGTATIGPTAPAYLPVQAGTATFGVYKGSNDFIYQREVY